MQKWSRIIFLMFRYLGLEVHFFPKIRWILNVAKRDIIHTLSILEIRFKFDTNTWTIQLSGSWVKLAMAQLNFKIVKHKECAQKFVFKKDHVDFSLIITM